jgi:hypothetical protein
MAHSKSRGERVESLTKQSVTLREASKKIVSQSKAAVARAEQVIEEARHTRHKAPIKRKSVLAYSSGVYCFILCAALDVLPL